MKVFPPLPSRLDRAVVDSEPMSEERILRKRLCDLARDFPGAGKDYFSIKCSNHKCRAVMSANDAVRLFHLVHCTFCGSQLLPSIQFYRTRPGDKRIITDIMLVDKGDSKQYYLWPQDLVDDDESLPNQLVGGEAQ